MRTIKVGLFQKEKGKQVIIYFLLFCLLILEARMWISISSCDIMV
jgi:hypothetical protein